MHIKRLNMSKNSSYQHIYRHLQILSGNYGGEYTYPMGWG